MTTWGISVSVENMADLESYIALLRRKYPDFTVYGILQLAAAASNRESVASGVPMDMRRVTEALSFMVAALLSATNLSILCWLGKTRSGSSGPAGATRWNITCMVFSRVALDCLPGVTDRSLLATARSPVPLMSNRLPSQT